MSEPTEYYDTIDLHIRWSDRQDLVLSVSPHDTISTVKQKICQMSPHAKGKYIRLIHSGRILEDNNTPSDYGLGKMTSDGSKSKMTPLPVYIHCSLSDYVPEQTSTKNQPTPNIPVTGFDRLRESGFTEDDIQNIRSQFHRLHGTPIEGDNEEARHLEEQWMDNTTDTLPDGTLQGTYKEMVWGLMLGFFLGVICLFWFRENVFSRRHQMGKHKISAYLVFFC
ncbi:DUF2407 C-terminal domain-containing protein [Phycomyces blakesleeanus]|uniref:DUF2407 C-terminal domain-containing protein n=1 Tax=Phycomyces blakesleeanus TaxID=4837 RepID=A0ABR3BAQ6_PHYBL